MKNVLLIIDPQEDFCVAKNGVGGALPVDGGREALARVAKFIDFYGTQLDDIVITLDSHNPIHIAHPIWFKRADGSTPPAYKTVKLVDSEIMLGSLDNLGQFVPEEVIYCRRAKLTQWTIDYLKKLESGHRYPHMLWPPHCLIGRPGYSMTPEIAESSNAWEEKFFGIAQKVSKGSNMLTEHFGALRAEVEDPKDPTTGVNTFFLQMLEDPDATIFLSGLALSHCVANTARDTANQFNADTFCQRCVLLEDGTESVKGLEFLGEAFVKDFKARGMRVAKTTDFK